MEEVVRKSRKDKYMASQKIEIGQTSVDRPQLIAPITTEDGRIGNKRMPLQTLQKCQKGTKKIAPKKKKNLKSNVFQSILQITYPYKQDKQMDTLPYSMNFYVFHCIVKSLFYFFRRVN